MHKCKNNRILLNIKLQNFFMPTLFFQTTWKFKSDIIIKWIENVKKHSKYPSVKPTKANKVHQTGFGIIIFLLCIIQFVASLRQLLIFFHFFPCLCYHRPYKCTTCSIAQFKTLPKPLRQKSIAGCTFCDLSKVFDFVYQTILF